MPSRRAPQHRSPPSWAPCATSGSWCSDMWTAPRCRVARRGRVRRASEATARALAGMHAVPLPCAPAHLARRARRRACGHRPQRALRRPAGARDADRGELANTAIVSPCAEGPAHRDFYDKRARHARRRHADRLRHHLRVVSRTRSGELRRPPHAEVAAGLRPAGSRRRTRTDVPEAYIAEAGAVDPERYRVTLATTWLRLLAVYAMRPLWHHLSRSLTDLAARAAQTECPTNPLLLTRTLFRARPLR